jgi:hypothetical protein
MAIARQELDGIRRHCFAIPVLSLLEKLCNNVTLQN